MRQPRNHVISVRLTEDELHLLVKHANVNVSDYVRQILMRHLRDGSRLDAIERRLADVERLEARIAEMERRSMQLSLAEVPHAA